jgi:hypothetical protein
MNPARNLRIAGLVLVLVGVSVSAVLNRVAALRARIYTKQMRLRTRVEEPGAIATMLGLALLEAGDEPDVQAALHRPARR